MAGKRQLAACRSSIFVTVRVIQVMLRLLNAHAVAFDVKQPDMPEGFHGGTFDTETLWRSWAMHQ